MLFPTEDEYTEVHLSRLHYVSCQTGLVRQQCGQVAETASSVQALETSMPSRLCKKNWIPGLSYDSDVHMKALLLWPMLLLMVF